MPADHKGQQLRSGLPEGTVTFLFTDIERSTDLLKQLGEGYKDLLADQRSILRDVFARTNGKEVDTQGDSFFISFPNAPDAVNACVEAQRILANHAWPGGVEVRVRMGLHTGEPWRTDEGYVGIDVHRAARIAAVGHGGQVLLSETVTDLVCDELPEGLSLRDLGSHQLKDIPQPEPIHQLVIEGLVSEFPPLTSLDSRPNNLPIQPTPFLGRMDELKALDALIADPYNRIISILGAGGMGKTRLAITTAEQQLHTMISSNGEEAPRFPDGAFLVGLAPLESVEAIVPTVGKALGLQFYESVDPKKQILDYLRRKRLLLVLDNFEHLTDGAGLLSEIVGAAPDVKILVTSREKLNLESEILYPLRGMRYPAEGEVEATWEPFSAVALFLQRASRVNPDFIPDDEGWRSVGRICRLVEGMPLGVELAAAWMELLSPAEIASEIQKGLDFLEAEKIDVPERHRSIRAVFDTAWGRMGEEEREILKAISVFRGGFTLDAARDVAGASNKQLLGLVNRSLLQRPSVDRFAIHELLRQYAEGRLGQAPTVLDKVRDRHCEYFADYLHKNEAAIDGGETAQALEDIDNIRTAWNWAVSKKMIPEIRKQIHSFEILHDFGGWYREAESLFKHAVDSMRLMVPAGEMGIVYGMLLAELGFFSYRTGKRVVGLDYLRESQVILRRLGAKLELADSVCIFGFLCDPGDLPDAKHNLLQSLSDVEEKQNPLLQTYLLNTLGQIYWQQTNYLEAEKYYREALQFGEALQNRRSIAWSTSGLGMIARSQGAYQEAREYFEQAYEHFESIGYKNMAGIHLSGLGETLNIMGEHSAAKELYMQALAIHEDMGKKDSIPYSIYGIGDCAYCMGEFEEAKGFYEEALTQFRDLEDPNHITIGMLLCDLGKVAVALNDIPEAQNKFIEAFDIAKLCQSERLYLTLFEGVSNFLLRKNKMERVIQLSSLIVNHLQSGIFAREEARKQLADLEGRLPLDEYSAALEKGKVLDLWTTVEQTLNELGT